MIRRGAPISVLLVDDEIEFLAAMARTLDRRGIDVYTASCGEEALGRLRQQPVDVLVLDVRMPGLDGEALYDLVRREQPGLPVIMLTAHGTLHQAFRMSREGVVAYLCKPCDVDDLVARVQEAARAAGGPGPAEAGRPAEENDGGPVHALLVDDEPGFLTALSRVLERRGIGSSLAASGEEALEALARRDFDVVVLDVKMPGLDGMQTLERIRRDHPDRRVILLTGHPTLRAAVDAIRLGALHYVVKPPDVDELAALIHEAACLRRRDSERRRREVGEALSRQSD